MVWKLYDLFVIVDKVVIVVLLDLYVGFIIFEVDGWYFIGYVGC